MSYLVQKDRRCFIFHVSLKARFNAMVEEHMQMMEEEFRLVFDLNKLVIAGQLLGLKTRIYQ